VKTPEARQPRRAARTAAERWGKNPAEKKSFLKTRFSAKLGAFQGLLGWGCDHVTGLWSGVRGNIRARRGAEPRTALAGYFSVLGSPLRLCPTETAAEIAAVASCPCVIVAHQRTTWRRYGLPDFRTPKKRCIAGGGRAAAPPSLRSTPLL